MVRSMETNVYELLREQLDQYSIGFPATESCPTDAMSLALRPEGQRPPIPSSGQELITRTAELRGTSFVPLAVLRRASQD